MQDWRFDDLTRTLGKATSRRGVLKGLLGGIVAVVIAGRQTTTREVAAAGRSCSTTQLQQCYADAKARHNELLAGCSAQPNEPSGSDNQFAQKFGDSLDFLCKTEMDRRYFNALAACDRAQCPDGGMCANGHCCRGENCCNPGVQCPENDGFGPSPWGPPPFCCAEGNSCCHDQCCTPSQTCCTQTQRGFLGFVFSGGSQTYSHQCSDLQSDAKNCGACGNDCGDQPCTDGQCGCGECAQWDEGSKQCVPRSDVERCAGNGYCCQGTCVPPCENGEAPDPKTCQCNICEGQIDGAACGDNLECCNQQCVSNQCPSPKVFDDQSCTCQCPPTTCPNGELLDPDTCQCVDLCANVTCGECQTCDPTSGDCIPVADQTACGNGQVCCSGTCQDTCDTCAGLPCSNGDCCANSTDWACCQDGCCPQVTINGQTGAYCVAPGPDPDGLGGMAGNCCQPADLVKGSYLNSDNQCDCSGAGPYEVFCSNNLGTDNIGTRCSCGPWFS